MMGSGRFARIGIPAPDLTGPSVGGVEIVCGALLVIGLLTRLATTGAGLTTTEVQSRLTRYGPNTATAGNRSPLWLQFLVRFRSPLVIILLVASGLSAATGDVAISLCSPPVVERA